MQWLVTSENNLLTDELSIKLQELPPNKKITVCATTQDAENKTWRSQAVFQSDAQGQIDLNQQASLSGSYQGVDGQGLFWSMQPQAKKTLFTLAQQTALKITLKAYAKKQVIGEFEIIRQVLPEYIQRIEIDNEKVQGVLFSPKGKNNLPAVIIVPGSSSVTSMESTAAMLATKGYVVFILAYYNFKNLPNEIYELPLEQIHCGINWLKDYPQVNQQKIAVMGASKGAEALLATLAYLPDNQIKAVIALSPSHVIWQGIGNGRPQRKSSWSLFNEPLHFLALNYHQIFLEGLLKNIGKKLNLVKLFPQCESLRLVHTYRQALKNKRREDEARIPVENIKAPLLLISGKEDLMWPASQMCSAIKTHLQKCHATQAITHLDLTGAGHVFRHPGVPTTIQQATFKNMTLAFGGQPKKMAQANQRYWSELLAFLQTYVG